jgi:hypothetical protein
MGNLFFHKICEGVLGRDRARDFEGGGRQATKSSNPRTPLKSKPWAVGMGPSLGKRPAGCTTFMAHEHIQVSEEWRIQILQQLELADLFVLILTQNYYGSIWCKQESGVAAFRKITIVPLPTDGTIPAGFIAHIQSTKIDPQAPTYQDLILGVAKRDVSFLIDGISRIISTSGNYRNAESDFKMILPYMSRATGAQIAERLRVSTKNEQVCNAALCAQTYLPPLFASHGHLLDAATKKELGDTLARY